MRKAIINGKLILKDAVVEQDIIYDQTILLMGKNLDTTDCEIIDAKGCYVSAGFLNIHVHGANGADVMDGKEESLNTIANALSKEGVTRFLATTMTMSKERIITSFDAVKDMMASGTSGSEILGIHVEGPFINLKKKGAQAAKYIVPPSKDLIHNHLDEVKLITLAPEVDGAIDFVKAIKRESNIKISLGHSNATFEEALAGYRAGVDSTTHLFNAMTPLHHREPGVIGAVLKEKPYFELIADTIHVHQGLFDVLGDCIGMDKMILVTDAMCACHMKPGTYELGGQAVVVDETSARLEDGTLAGSILKMDEAIRNMRANTNFKWYDILAMVTINPAQMLGLDNMGLLEKDYVADIVIFDEEIDIKYTIVNGEIRYRKG